MVINHLLNGVILQVGKIHENLQLEITRTQPEKWLPAFSSNLRYTLPPPTGNIDTQNDGLEKVTP